MSIGVEPYRPFLDDPRDIAALEGQRFIVLRAAGDAVDAFLDIQAPLRRRLAGSAASFPAYPHVTLCGFAPGTPVSTVQDLASSWGRQVAPLSIELERIGLFAADRVIVVGTRKTGELFEAFADLRSRAAGWKLPVSTPVPVDEWVFHMSAAYCARVDETAWDDVTRFAETLRVKPARCVADRAEVVAFDRHREHLAGVYRLQAL